MRRSSSGFSLLEIMVTIVISAIVIVASFASLSKIMAFRGTVTGALTADTQTYTAMERLVMLIKNGGTIDYEEYWNRRIAGTGTINGHYAKQTGYGNYGTN